MSRKHLQELIKSLQEFYQCPSCQASYHFDDIKFLGEVDLHYFVQLSCHNCTMPVVTAVSVGKDMFKKKRTELQKTEELKFVTKGTISAGEIAEFHRFISRYNGTLADFTK